MNKPQVWITGAGGLIGNYLVQTAPQFAPQFRIRPLTRAELDLKNFGAVRELFGKESPEMIIHCAALANTPACEKNPALAHQLNVDVTALLAELAAEIPFILFSTDLVFDGGTGNYDESAEVNPLSAYAKTKVEAERIVLANAKHTVVRTSLNFGTSITGDRAFNEQMRSTAAREEMLKLFVDEFRCPIPAEVTARAVWELAALDKPGVHHLAGSERLSRWEIGQLLAAYWAPMNVRMEQASIRNFRGLPRSPDTSMNCAKIQKLLSFPLPKFSEWIAKAAG